jgi:hypothetical protein
MYASSQYGNIIGISQKLMLKRDAGLRTRKKVVSFKNFDWSRGVFI